MGLSCSLVLYPPLPLRANPEMQVPKAGSLHRGGGQLKKNRCSQMRFPGISDCIFIGQLDISETQNSLNWASLLPGEVDKPTERTHFASWHGI